MRYAIIVVALSLLLTGCPHHTGRYMPRDPSPEELILGAIVISGIVALDIAEEVSREKTACKLSADCPEGYYCNYSKNNCDKMP